MLGNWKWWTSVGLKEMFAVEIFRRKFLMVGERKVGAVITVLGNTLMLVLGFWDMVDLVDMSVLTKVRSVCP